MHRIIDGYALIETCGACPEQYDVYSRSGQLCGYLRLRHGIFTADYPKCGGEEVYSAEPRGDGCFFEEEREKYLTKAIAAIDKAHKAYWKRLMDGLTAPPTTQEEGTP